MYFNVADFFERMEKRDLTREQRAELKDVGVKLKGLWSVIKRKRIFEMSQDLLEVAGKIIDSPDSLGMSSKDPIRTYCFERVLIQEMLPRKTRGVRGRPIICSHYLDIFSEDRLVLSTSRTFVHPYESKQIAIDLYLPGAWEEKLGVEHSRLEQDLICLREEKAREKKESSNAYFQKELSEIKDRFGL